MSKIRSVRIKTPGGGDCYITSNLQVWSAIEAKISPRINIASFVAMGKSKAAKRKRTAQADLPHKLPKAASIITPPPDAATPESTHLNAVVSDEDLDITIETLTALAEYPSLTKSKACKDLRVAVYEFRQTCTTGVNTAGNAAVFSPLKGIIGLIIR